MSTEKNSNRAGPRVRSLPLDYWPSADRAAWEEACRPSVRFKRGGAASHFRPVTQKELSKRYGLFLGFLERSGKLELNAAASALVIPDHVQGYVTELQARTSSVNVYSSIQKLRRMVQLIAPAYELDWLIAIERQLFSEMRPRSRWHRVVYTEVLVDAGLTLMAEAEMFKMSELARARMFRNGLIIAVLALCPIRLKNFAALEIGRSFVNVDDTWWIVLTEGETKEKRVDERPIEQELTASIERYLAVYRPILARGNASTNSLWMAINGKPMTYASLKDLIPEITRMTVGIPVNPHMFRTAGATTLATHAGDKPHAASALLHHRPGPVTQGHYNRASCISAGRSLASLNRCFRTAPDSTS
jgi:integrase